MIVPTAWPGEAPELAEGEVHVWSLAAELAQDALPEILAAQCGTDSVRIERDPSGKPYVAEPADHDLGFNLSHSGERALVAVARGRAVGVDVQEIRPVARASRIAERMFRPEDVAALRELEGPEREAAFFRFWARTEARVKATGAGLAGAPGDGCEVFDVEAGPGYAAAVAITGPVGGGPRSP